VSPVKPVDYECLVATNEADEGVKKAGVCRKQWAAPRESMVRVFVNADVTSSSTGSTSVTDSDTAPTMQSPPGHCSPDIYSDLPVMKCVTIVYRKCAVGLIRTVNMR